MFLLNSGIKDPKFTKIQEVNHKLILKKQIWSLKTFSNPKLNHKKNKNKKGQLFCGLLSKLSIQSKHATTTSSVQRTPTSNTSVGVLVSLSSRYYKAGGGRPAVGGFKKNRWRHLRQFYRVCRKVPSVSCFSQGGWKDYSISPRLRSQNQGIICIGYANQHPLPHLANPQGTMKIPWLNGWGLGYAKRVETGQEHWMLGFANPKQTDGKRDA